MKKEKNTLFEKLLTKVQTKIYKDDSNLIFDFNGHYNFDLKSFKAELVFHFYNFSEENLNCILNNEKFFLPIEMKISCHDCPYCGERINYLFDGKTIIAKTECLYPGGMKEFSLELNCPSGKMVFANDLREWFKIHGSFNINNDVGQMLCSKSYEKVGMVHGFVGNSCPGVYQISEKELSISDHEAEEFWDESIKKYLPATEEYIKKTIPPGKRIGGICTDLWWYSIVDLDDFKIRFLDMGGSEEEFITYLKNRCDVASVKPGVYKITHYPNKEDWNDRSKRIKPLHYSLLSWYRESENHSYYEEYKNLNFTIGQCYLSAITNYSNLYGFSEEEFPELLSMEDRVAKLKQVPIEVLEESVQRFYDHTFCTLGNGVDWHRNGWGTSNEIIKDTPDFSLPPLTKRYSWYPMSRNYCALYLAAFDKTTSDGKKVHFNESFSVAAYEIVQNIITYGSESSFNIEKTIESKKEEKEQIKIAKECLNALNKNVQNNK